MTELDLTDGKIFLNKVTEKIRTRLAEVDASIEAGQKDIQSMNEYYWENYTEMDEYGYENYDNQQALLHQVNDNQEKLKMQHRLRKMLEAPFFGRVDFIYDGEDEPEIFYIGIGNFAERTGMLPLIYDWRAPVSGLFYDYDKGPGSYEAPAGLIEGEIAAKWQYKVKNGKMVYAFESDTKIDDDILSRSWEPTVMYSSKTSSVRSRKNRMRSSVIHMTVSLRSRVLPEAVRLPLLYTGLPICCIMTESI